MAAAVAVAVVSCKKEKPQQTNDTGQCLQNSDNMDEYLMAFKKKLLSAEKGGETISLEQAARDLGNLLNFDFGDANYATDVFQRDTIRLELSTTNGMVDLSQLAITYNNAVGEIIETYQNSYQPETSIYAICCNFNGMNSKDGETEDVEIVMVRGEVPPQVNSNINDLNDWRPTNKGGMCDGQLVGSMGAPEMLASWLNCIPTNQFECVNGGRLYFTEISSSSLYGTQTQIPSTNQYMIYTSTILDQTSVCITHPVMVYYYNQILSLWHSGAFNNSLPPDHVMMSVEITHCYHHNQWTWLVRIHHGKPNCTDSEPLL